MEGKTKLVIFIFFILTFFWNCKNNNNHLQVATNDTKSKNKNVIKTDTIRCKNDPSLYSELVPKLLYKDSLSRIHLRIKQVIHKSPLGGELSECEKIPYGYIDIMGTLDDSIVNIKDFLDVKSFRQFDQTDIFFFDKNGVYVFQDSPATYPQFFEIDIDSKKASIVDSIYIKDLKGAYWKGIKIQNANAISLTSTKLNTTNGEKINLVYDDKHLYHLDKIYDIKRLNNLPFNEKTIDSLRFVFFK